jgi:hypothetical protein
MKPLMFNLVHSASLQRRIEGANIFFIEWVPRCYKNQALLGTIHILEKYEVESFIFL